MSPISSDPKVNESSSSPSGSLTANTSTPYPAVNGSRSSDGDAQSSSNQQTPINPLDVNSVIADAYHDLAKGEEYATMIENKLSQFDEKVKLFYASLGIEWDPNEEIAVSDDDEDEGEEEEPGAGMKNNEVNGENKENLKQMELTEEELKILNLMDSFVVAPSAPPGDGNGKV